MSNVCIIRHKGYIKSRVHFPYKHNMRKQECYSNKNIKQSHSKFNTIIESNLKENETFLKAFNHLYNSGEFTGQLKVQGNVEKQTKFLDEFLFYPSYEVINKMSLYEQDQFFQKELKALRNYFPHMIILSAVVHRDEVFHPLDDEMKALFPSGKITPHMHVISIPIVHDKKTDSKKLSISELWKGKNSYRKFQDYMYDTVGKEYGFDRGEILDIGETKKHLEVEEFKLQESKKSLQKIEYDIKQKEEELIQKAKDLAPEEHINMFNAKRVAKEQKVVHLALMQEKEKNILIQKEKDELISTLKSKDDIIHNLRNIIDKQQEKLSETEKKLSDEKDINNSILNIKLSDDRLRADMIQRAQVKIRLFDLLVETIRTYLPLLKKNCKEFVNELVRLGILSDKSDKDVHNREHR